MNFLIGLILIAILSLELLVPLLALNKLQTDDPTKVQQSSNNQILVIFFSTMVFAGSCSSLTSARRQEVFAATAAYCAVLVVFLGNSSNIVFVSK